MLEINIENLVRAGARRIAVNVHHFGEQIMEYLGSREWGVEIVVSDERDCLLNTGGGVKRAGKLLTGEEAIVVHNVDILSRVDLGEMGKRNRESGAVATLAVSRRETKRQLMFDGEGRLSGWHNRESGEYIRAGEWEAEAREYAFSGIAVLRPEVIEMLPEEGRGYPIIPEYLKIAGRHRIDMYEHEASDWLDVGSPATLAKAEAFLNKR